MYKLARGEHPERTRSSTEGSICGRVPKLTFQGAWKRRKTRGILGKNSSLYSQKGRAVFATGSIPSAELCV